MAKIQNLVTTELEVRDIPEAWFEAVRINLVRSTFEYAVKYGSMEEIKRREFDCFRLVIHHPESRPFEPELPKDSGIPNPVAPGYIDTYYREKILYGFRDDNEDYVYGERLSGILVRRHNDGTLEDPVVVGPNQIEIMIERFKKHGPNTNQTFMSVARPEDALLKDPPCLTGIDLRWRYDKLHFFVYFRSWDLWGGFPANLGALQLLKEYMAEEIGTESGQIIAFSKGLHIYGYALEVARSNKWWQY